MNEFGLFINEVFGFFLSFVKLFVSFFDLYFFLFELGDNLKVMYFFIIDGIGEFMNLVFIVKDLMLDIFFLIELLLLFKYNLLLLSLCKILLLFKVFLFFIFLCVVLLLLVFFLGNLV